MHSTYETVNGKGIIEKSYEKTITEKHEHEINKYYRLPGRSDISVAIRLHSAGAAAEKGGEGQKNLIKFLRPLEVFFIICDIRFRVLVLEVL
jgi:hypothetical protein